MKQLSQAGVAVFAYLDDREIVLDSPTDKFLLAAVNFAAEFEREKNRQRAWDKAASAARRGHVAGGRVFGYDNVRIDSHVERRINDSRPPPCAASSSSRLRAMATRPSRRR